MQGYDSNQEPLYGNINYQFKERKTVQILAKSLYVCGGKAYASSNHLKGLINSIYHILYHVSTR